MRNQEFAILLSLCTAINGKTPTDWTTGAHQVLELQIPWRRYPGKPTIFPQPWRRDTLNLEFSNPA